MPKRPTPRGVTFATFRRWALALHGVTEGRSYGLPSFLAFDKFLARKRFEAEGGVVLKTGSMQERDHLLATSPDVFFITDHYRDYPAVLVRLEAADPGVVRELLESSWRRMAPKKVLKEYDDGPRRSARTPGRPGE